MDPGQADLALQLVHGPLVGGRIAQVVAGGKDMAGVDAHAQVVRMPTPAEQPAQLGKATAQGGAHAGGGFEQHLEARGRHPGLFQGLIQVAGHRLQPGLDAGAQVAARVEDHKTKAQLQAATEFVRKGSNGFRRRDRVRGRQVDEVRPVRRHRHLAAGLPLLGKQADFLSRRRLDPPLALVGGEDLQRLAAHRQDAVKGAVQAAGDGLVGAEQRHQPCSGRLLTSSISAPGRRARCGWSGQAGWA